MRVSAAFSVVSLANLATAIELVLEYRHEKALEKAPRGAEETSVLV